jgi:enoyl-CoA hydratase/carnithine racemase
MIAVAMGHLALLIRFLTAALRWAGVHLSARYISLLLTQPVLGGDDFDADIAERYGLVNRTLDDDGLDSFVDTLVRRLASFDRQTIAAAKAQINRFGMPTATELQSSNDMFLPLLARPSAQARLAKVRDIGYGIRSDFELNFGRLPHRVRAGRRR